MRWIEPNEPCYTASEIVEMFKERTGVVFHPTVVGQIARKRDLDYIEIEEEITNSLGKQMVVARRKYGHGDLPVIFADLQAKVDERAIYENSIKMAHSRERVMPRSPTMEKLQDVKLTYRQWLAFSNAAKSSWMIKTSHDLDVAVNQFLRLWYVRTHFVEQQIEMDTEDGPVRCTCFCQKGSCVADENERLIGEPVPLDRYPISELEGIFCLREEGEWTIPAVDDVPLTDDGRLANQEMLRAWREFCGVA